MHDITHFTLRDMTECGATLRAIGKGTRSMEEVARRIVRYLYDDLASGRDTERACVLVRFFKTHSYGELDADLRRFADTMLGGRPRSAVMKCLTLLATSGERPEWNTRARSVAHRAIPLPSAQAVARIPMISQLVKQLGVESATLVEPAAGIMVDAEQRSYNVFYVPEARDSPYIPAQADFVVPAGIRSVLGFGGLLPATAFAMSAAQGDIYYGLWYPIVFAGITLVIGMLFLPETKDRDIHAGDEMNHMALRLAAGEYAEVKAVLEAEGLKVSGRPGDDECIYFSDPDGHRLQVLTLKEQNEH